MKMSRVQWGMAGGILLSLVPAGSTLLAQHVAAAPRMAVESTVAKTVLERKVSVDIQNASLIDAVKAVASQAGIRLQYQNAHLEAVRTLVSIRAANESLGAVMQEVLAGTPLSVLVVDPGLVAIVSSPAQRSSEDGIITGKVINAKTKEPIAGATIVLGDKAPRATTNRDGAFRVSVAAGEYQVVIRAVGFVRQVRAVTVSEGTTMLELALEPSASVLDEVIVTGTVVATERKEIPNPITVITAEEIERRGITDIGQFFRGEVPGVLMMERGTFAYSDDAVGGMEHRHMYSRGVGGLSKSSGQTPLKTYVDGVELLDPSAIGTIDPSSIERIEIVTGPQAATIYGSGALGGVMQIFTKKGAAGTTADVVANLRYGMLQNNMSSSRAPTHNHTVGVSGGLSAEFTYSANVSHTATGQWQPGLYTRSYGGSAGLAFTKGNLAAQGSMNARIGWNGTAGNNGHIYQVPRMQAGKSAHQDHWPLSKYFRQRVSRSNAQTFSLSADYRVTPQWRHGLTIGLNATEFSLVPERPAYSEAGVMEDTLYVTRRSTGRRVSASYNTGWNATYGIVSSVLTTGITGSKGDQLQLRGCMANETASSWVACSNSVYGLTIQNALNDESVGWFATWRIGLFDKLYTTMGIRGERNPSYGTDHKIDWTPTNGLAFNMDYGIISLKLMASYGRATKAPGPEDRLAQWDHSASYIPSTYQTRYANPNLTPQYSRGPQGGFELYIGNIGSLAINHYRQSITDLIQYIRVDSIVLGWYSGGTVTRWIYQYMNTANVKQVGWDGTGTLQLGNLSLKAVYAWNDSRVTESRTAGFVPGQTIAGVPTHSGNLTIGYAHRTTSVSLVTNYIGSRIDREGYYELMDNIANARLPVYQDKGEAFTYSRLPWMSVRGYYKTDLAMSHRITPNISFLLNVVNLGNGYGSDVNPLLPVLGRKTVVGVSLRN